MNLRWETNIKNGVSLKLLAHDNDNMLTILLLMLVMLVAVLLTNDDMQDEAMMTPNDHDDRFAVWSLIVRTSA
jgi:hypothetical protein